MQDWMKTIREALSRGRGKKITGLVVLPVVVVLLILVIVVADSRDSAESKESPPRTEQSAESKESIPAVSLKKDEVPELTALVQAYCQAKADCDVEALAAVFGMTDTAAFSGEAANMELVSRIVESYENVACYSIEGPAEDTYVIYPYFEIQYKDAVSLMPSLTWSFARKNQDGRFYMTEDITREEKEYIAKVSKSQEVQQLKEDVIARQDAAVMEDAELQRIYN